MSRPVTAARSERPVIGWATALLLASVLPQYLIGALAVEMRSDFRFSDAQLGVAVGISFAISAVVAPMAGRTVRWIGVRRGVVLTAALVTVSSVAIGSAQDATTVIVLMGFVGLAGGVGSPCLSSLLAEEVGTARHGTAFGLFSCRLRPSRAA